MALKLTLKPGERFVVNGAVIQNGDRRSSLVIQNRASILRERDILQAEDASTPMRRVYFTIQMMYLDDKGARQYMSDFESLIADFMNAIKNQEALALCVNIIRLVNDKQYYKALIACRTLYPFEEARLNYVPDDIQEYSESN